MRSLLSEGGHGRSSGGNICAEEHKDYARRRVSREPRWSSSAGAWRPFAKLNPRRALIFAAIVLMEILTYEGSIMQEQLAIVDLGDAMLETRCSLAIGPQFDFTFGAGHWRC